MAEEKIKELPVAPIVAKEKSPWLPILVMIVLQPLLLFVVVQFLVLPKIQNAYTVSLEKIKEPMMPDTKKEDTMFQYPFENIVANIAGSFQSRYVKVSFTVAGTDSSFEQIVFEKKAKIEDATLGVLSSLTILDFEQPGIQNIIRADLLIAFETALGSDIIRELYFSEFVVQ